MFESLCNTVAGLQPCNFIEKRLERRCFPVNISKFFRTPIMKNISEWLLLADAFITSEYIYPKQNESKKFMHLISKSLCIIVKKLKFSVQNFFSKRDQNHSLLRICSHLLKKLLKENFIVCALYLFIFGHCNASKAKKLSL